MNGWLTPTVAALFGSVATALAIFAGGLAVERDKRRRDRSGMALGVDQVEAAVEHQAGRALQHQPSHV